MTATSTLTSKNQTTIPKDVVSALDANILVRFLTRDDPVQRVNAKANPSSSCACLIPRSFSP